VVRVIKRGEGHYKARRNVEACRVYGSRPECGETKVLTGSVTCCECGTDYTPIIRKEFAAQRPQEYEAAHPWRSLHYSACAGVPD
jgi:hypothetical protein